MVYQLPSTLFDNELGKGLVMADTFVAEDIVSRERVLVFIVGSACRIIGANVTNRCVHPSEFAKIAEAYYSGDIVAAYACLDTRESAQILWHELDGCGYTKLASPLKEHSNPIIEYIPLLFREARRVDRIIFIAEQRMVPLSFIGGMHAWGVKVTILTPRTKPVETPYAETVIPLCLALKRLSAPEDEPLIRTLDASSRSALPTSSQPAEQPCILEMLVHEDPSSVELVFDTLFVTNATLDSCLEHLGDALRQGTLPPILAAALLALSVATVRESDGAQIIPKHHIWQELIRYGIDIEDAGLPAIAFLLEEHVLHRLESKELLLVRPRPDPLLALARAFQDALRQQRDNIPQVDGLPEYANTVLATLTIWKEDPARLTGQQWLLLQGLMRNLINRRTDKQRAWWYKQHGFTPNAIATFEDLAVEALRWTPDEPKDPIDDESSHDSERPSAPSGTSLRTAPTGPRLKAVAS